MKRFKLSGIWQWTTADSFFAINPIGISFEYEFFGPELIFKFVLLGVGFQIYFRCPWETQYSKWAKDNAKNLSNILTIGGDLVDEYNKRK